MLLTLCLCLTVLLYLSVQFCKYHWVVPYIKNNYPYIKNNYQYKLLVKGPLDTELLFISIIQGPTIGVFFLPTIIPNRCYGHII